MHNLVHPLGVLAGLLLFAALTTSTPGAGVSFGDVRDLPTTEAVR